MILTAKCVHFILSLSTKDLSPVSFQVVQQFLILPYKGTIFRKEYIENYIPILIFSTTLTEESLIRRRM